MPGFQSAERNPSCGGRPASPGLPFWPKKFFQQEEHPLPDLILLNLRLPKVDGLEVLRQVKEDENLKIIPVVIPTTSESKVDGTQTYKNHANSYLVKPVTGESFDRLMGNFKAYWFGANYLFNL